MNNLLSPTLKVPIIPKVYDAYQELNDDIRHFILVGGRGKGASWSVARLLLLRGMLEPYFFPCVREVQKTIKYSVKKLLDDQIKNLGLDWFYKSTDNEIKGINGTLFAFFGLHDYNSDNIKSLEGADWCWVAEAQSISRKSMNILRPTIRKEGSKIVWDFNPRYATDPIWLDYIINDDPYAKVLWLNWKDNPWFTKALNQEREADYNRNQEEAEHIWEGKIRADGDKFVCPHTLVDKAFSNGWNDESNQYQIEVGADIAHQGGDEIVFYKRQGLNVIDKYISKYQSTPKTVKDLKAFAGDRSVIIKIDNGSLGAAVADYLEEDNWMVARVNFGGSPKDKEHYEDAVTEMYFELRDLLQVANLEKDDTLREQLVQRRYNYINGKRGYEVMKIESKKEFASHATLSNKSPDRADALVLCFYDIEDSYVNLDDIEAVNIL